MSPLRGAIAGLRRRPVRIRIAILSGAMTALILIAFALVVGRLVSNRLRADFRDEISNTAQALAADFHITPDGVGGLNITGGQNIGELATASDAVIKVVDVNGNAFAQSSGVSLGAPTSTGALRAVGDLEVADAPVVSFSGYIATPKVYVQYARSTEPTDRTIARLWLFLGGGVLVGSLLAAFAGMMVAQRAMRPIADLTGTARTIARTRDPSLRIPEPENEDEVAELARTLDEMLRELDAARNETEATIQRQREFVADASHELRTPLTSILANLELLEEDIDPGDEDGLAATRSALRSSRRMSRLVGDLLILARADAGRRNEPVRCDLARIAGEAFEEVDPVADGHILAAQLDREAEVLGNPDELHRMVLNLLENSIRHTPEGTHVELDLRRNGSRVVLTVSDDGPGLPAGQEEAIFGRFVRGAGPADRQGGGGKGTGLGLAIVKAVAVAHGGDAVARTSNAGGALFEIDLPLAEADLDPSED